MNSSFCIDTNDSLECNETFHDPRSSGLTETKCQLQNMESEHTVTNDTHQWSRLEWIELLDFDLDSPSSSRATNDNHSHHPSRSCSMIESPSPPSQPPPASILSFLHSLNSTSPLSQKRTILKQQSLSECGFQARKRRFYMCSRSIPSSSDMFAPLKGLQLSLVSSSSSPSSSSSSKDITV